jgi:uncharacterized protein
MSLAQWSTMRLVKQRDNSMISDDVEVADTWIAHLRGLIGRRTFPDGSVLLIPGCKQVHTFLMRFPIDLVFVDSKGKVVDVAERLRPCRISGYCRSADKVIELPAGTVSSCDIRMGDTLLFCD